MAVQVTIAANQIDKQRIKHKALSISHLDDEAEPSVLAGSKIEIGGALYEFDVDETGTDWAGIAVSSVVYAFLYPVGTACTWGYAVTVPTWNTAKQGWYSGINRAFMKLYKDAAGNYASKETLETAMMRTDFETLILDDVTLTKAGKYRACVPCSITLPVSIQIGGRIEIFADYPVYILQADAENVISCNGRYATIKGVTAYATGAGTGYVLLKAKTRLVLTYKGVSRYRGGTATYIGGFPSANAFGMFVAWSPNGKYIALATWTASPYLQWWKRAGDTLTKLTDPASGVSNGWSVDWSPDGNYLALGVSLTPYAQWWKRSGDTLTYIGGLVALGAGAYHLRWSPDGNYLACATGASAAYLRWFKRTGDTLTLIGAAPSAIVGTYGVAWSPDSLYLVGCGRTVSPYGQWWKRSGDVLTYIGTIPSVPANVSNAAWSPDGTKLVLTHGTVSPYASLYKRNGDVLTLIGSLPSAVSGAYEVQWSPDGNYIMIGDNTTSPYTQWWQVIGDTVLYIGGLPSAVTGAQYGCFSPDGEFMAIGTYTNSPYAQWWRIVSDASRLYVAELFGVPNESDYIKMFK